MIISNMKAELIDYMGDDNSVVNAARVSFAKDASNYTDEENAKLIRYLAKHNHFTTFCHAFLSFRIKAPLFVARQLVKHQVGLSWNEESRRYIDSEPEFWFPSEFRNRPEGSVKQGSAGINHLSDLYIECSKSSSKKALELYNAMLTNNVAPEQARIVLPLNTMTNWVWSGSLFAFARVCNLRLDPHAQIEVQEIAKLISEEVSSKFPISWKYLVEDK